MKYYPPLTDSGMPLIKQVMLEGKVPEEAESTQNTDKNR